MQKIKLEITKIYIMNLKINFIDLITNADYWNQYKEYKKIKSILYEFFDSEDEKLQKSFFANFDYPEDMIHSPVRFTYDYGDIYYTINFKSKELFENEGTKEKALTNSLAILDKYLPLGVTQYLEPQAPIHIPDTFTLLCYLKVKTDVTDKKTIINIIGTIIKPLIILSSIVGLVKYFI